MLLKEEIANTFFASVSLNACLRCKVKGFSSIFDKINDHILGGLNNAFRLSPQENFQLGSMRSHSKYMAAYAHKTWVITRPNHACTL